MYYVAISDWTDYFSNADNITELKGLRLGVVDAMTHAVGRSSVGSV